MSNNKDNEILDQRKKAREEFIHLKMMQQGKEKAPPKPSEEAIIPKTPLEKFENFWFHNKLYVIAVLILTIIITTCVVQCSKRVNYDLKIVAFTYEQIGSDNLEPMADYFEQYCEDINGDNEVNIQILNCSYNAKDNNAQYKNAMYQKLTSIIAAEPSALLYITDSESYEYIYEIAEGITFFEKEPITLKDEFYEKSSVENSFMSYVPKNLSISCRIVDDTLLEKDKNIDKYYEQSQNILKAIS